MNLFSLFIDLDMDTTNFNTKASGVLSTLRTLGNQLGGSSGKKGLTSQSILFGNMLSTALIRAGDSLFSMGKNAAKTGIEYEQRMSEVQAVSGATAEEMADLDRLAREMGAQTKFSATEAADALYYMGQAGWDSGEMIAGLPGIMNLAAASGEKLGRTSDIVTDALTAFGEPADQAQRFADVLAVVAAKTNTDVAQMGNAFSYVAPVAGALGYEIEDVAVALGIMANSGVKASKAGTALRGLFSNLANPTGPVSKAMYDLDVALADDKGNMLSLLDLLTQTREAFNGLDDANKHLFATKYSAGMHDPSEYESGYDEYMALFGMSEGLSEEQKAEYASKIAYKTGMAGLLAIVNATDKDLNQLIEDIYGAEGAAEDMATIMMDNVAGSMEETSGALETLGLNLFDLVKEPFQSVVDDATAGVNALNSALISGDTSRLGRWLDTIGEKGAQGLEDGVNGAIGAFNSLFDTDVEEIPWLSEATMSALSNLSLFLTDAADASQLLVKTVVDFTKENPFFTEAITALGLAFFGLNHPLRLVAAAVALLVTNWGSVKTAVGGAWLETKSFLGATYENKVKPIVDALAASFETLWNWIVKAGNAIADFFGIEVDPNFKGGTSYDPTPPEFGPTSWSDFNPGISTDGGEVFGPKQQTGGVTVNQYITSPTRSAVDLQQEAARQLQNLYYGGKITNAAPTLSNR